MAVQTITYDDKSYLNQNSSIADINKVNDTDMNMIKSVVNNNATETSNNTTAIANLTPVSLYDNASGSTGSVTLSSSSANFTYLEIFYMDENNSYSSVRIYNSNGKNVSLISSQITSGKIQFYAKNILISGTSITNVNGYTIIFTGSTFGGYNNSNNYILITKVLGYK